MKKTASVKTAETVENLHQSKFSLIFQKDLY